MKASLPLIGALEQQLLLNCARVEMDDALSADTAGLLQQDLSWDAVVFYARLHSVASLLHLHIKRLDTRGMVPEPVKMRLLQLVHRTAYQNGLFAAENARIVGEFDAAGVPVLVQKGLPVVEHLYGNLGLRPLIDLIYLIPASATARAAGVLEALGYRERIPFAVEGLYRWCCPQPHFKRAGDLEMSVLLQRTLVNWPRLHRLDEAGCWRRARRMAVSGRPTLVLAPTDLLLYLCLQADNQGYFNRVAVDEDPRKLLFTEWTNNRLVRFADVHHAVERLSHEIEWNAIRDYARHAGLEDALASTLTLTHALLGTTIDPGLLQDLHRSAPKGIRLWLFHATRDDRSARPLIARWGRAAWFSTTARRRLRAIYMVGLAELAFPKRATLAAHYGIRSGVTLAAVRLLHAGRVLASTAGGYLRFAMRRLSSRVRGSSKPSGTTWLPAESTRTR